jgi:hypothetical protein
MGLKKKIKKIRRSMIKDLTLILTSILLSISIIFFFTKEHPRIVVVDKSELYKEFVLAISKSVGSDNDEEIAQKIEIHKIAVGSFNTQIAKTAQDNNLIILNKNNVIAGGLDQTDEARELLKQLMKGVDHE